MSWNISVEMVDELLAAGVPGLTTRLQAMLVFQHCTVHSLSLFDFFAKWRIEGLRLVPAVDPPNVRELPEVSIGAEIAPGLFAIELPGSLPAAAAFVEEEFPDERFVAPAAAQEGLSEMSYVHSDWRSETLSARRLEKLRLHMAEVKPLAEQYSGWAPYFEQLKNMEASLARVVEPVPTLGMVADDEVEAEVDEPTAETMDDIESELEGVAAQPREEHIDFSQPDEPSESLPVIAPASRAEQDDIAAVLANPKGAKPVESSAPRKDAAGRVLVSDSTLEQMYGLGQRLGMNRVQVEEFVCEKHKLRKVNELPDAIALKIVDNMIQRIAKA